MDRNIINYSSILEEELQKLRCVVKPYESSTDIRVALDNIEMIYETKIKTLKPQIMFFGIYNAGKSSILNEFLGEDKAPVGDVPTTHDVTLYKWHDYEIADTPGVGAPVEDEKVTNEHLKKADIVIFAMSTTGGFDKAENYSRMLDIVNAGKKVIIVLNDKNGDLGKNDIVIQQLKGKVAYNMQQVGIDSVANKYCIITVNAKRAKNGRLTNNEKLIAASNIKELEDIVLTELKNTNGANILRNAIYEIEQSINKIITSLSNSASDDETKSLNKILVAIQGHKTALRNSMKEYIKNQAGRLSKTLPDLIWANKDNQDNVEKVISQEISYLSDRVQRKMESELKDVQDDIAVNIENFVDEINKIKVKKDYSFKVKDINAPISEIDSSNENNDWAINIENINKLIDVGEEMVNIYTTKKKGKLPDLSDIVVNCSANKAYAETFEKIALPVGKMITKKIAATQFGKSLAEMAIVKSGGSIVTKFIPYVGPILTAWSVLNGIFGGDAERSQNEAYAEEKNQEAQMKLAAEQQARLDLQQKCAYMADDVAEDLQQAMNEVIRDAIGSVQEVFSSQIKTSKDDANARTIALDEVQGVNSKLEIFRTDLDTKLC